MNLFKKMLSYKKRFIAYIQVYAVNNIIYNICRKISMVEKKSILNYKILDIINCFLNFDQLRSIVNKSCSNKKIN